MFRSMRITVNGKMYDVTVEENGNGPVLERTPVYTSVAPMQAAPPAASAVSAVSAPAQAVHADSAAQPVSAASPAQTSAASRSSGGEGVLKSPIPGTVTSIKVTENQKVSKGDVVLILEAMKMENEICAHADGLISNIFVQTGTMLNTGDPILEIS